MSGTMTAPAAAQPGVAHPVAAVLERRPLAGTWGLIAAQAAYVLLGALLLRALAPSLSGFAQSGVLTVLNVPIWAALLGRFGWWRRVGFVGSAEWRHLGLLVLPALLALLPLAGGLRPVAPLALLALVAGYAATAFIEETIFRGIILDLLAPSGVGRAVAISSLLFGGLHLQNVLFRGSPALVVAQAIGCVCFGVGYAALRLRTNTIWTVIALHALTDLLLQLTALPLGAKIGLMVGQDTALLIFGLIILRRAARLAR